MVVAGLLAAASRVDASPFERQYGDEGHDRDEYARDVASVDVCAPRGGAILVGYTAVPSSSWAYEPRIIRTAADGSTLWENTYRMEPSASAKSVIELRDGSGFIVAGQQYGALLVMKVACTGDLLWARTYSLAGVMVPAQILETSFGPSGFIVAGALTRAGGGTRAASLVRLDPRGELLWSQTYSAANGTSFASVTELSGSGDILVAGTVSHGETFAAYPLLGRFNRDGRRSRPEHGLRRYDRLGEFTSVIELKRRPYTGDIVIAGNLLRGQEAGSFLLIHETGGAHPKRRAVTYGANDVDPSIQDVREVQHAQAHEGTSLLAIAGTSRLAPELENDALLLLASVPDLAPVSGKLYGDGRGGREALGDLAVAVAEQRSGFLLGVVAQGPQHQPRNNMRLVSTDLKGRSGCEADWLPSSFKSEIAPMKEPLALAAQPLTVEAPDVFVKSHDTGMDICR